MLRRNKVLSCMLTAVMSFSLLMPVTNAYAFSKDDYKTAFKDVIDFYDANKCGSDVAKNNTFPWRGACHLNDGKNVENGLNVDLTGGYHDAGDHVKFGLPQAYTASVMGWALHDFKDGFKKGNMYNKQLEQLKYFTDYLIKCHYAPGKFVYQVGDGNDDHNNYWGAPEKEPESKTSRQTYLIADSGHPASDVLGEATAALAIMYLNYKDIDQSYADNCLKHAKELYQMGKSNQGKNSLGDFYRSGDYGDDMSWGAAWLYDATKDQSYLKDAKDFIVKENQWLDTNWTMCWDNMRVAAVLKLYQLTGDSTYKKSVDYNMNCWLNMSPTDGKLKALTDWGALRYSAAASMIALLYNKSNPSKSLVDFASSQIDYIMGDNGPHMSYIVGFGSKWPQHVHHRAANGYDVFNNGSLKSLPNKYVLTGALVGGPFRDGSFIDDLDKYQYTEVAIDYNAGLVGAIAGYGEIIWDDIPSNPGDINGDGVINVADYSLFRKYFNAGGPEGNIKINVDNADVNGDSQIDFFDLVALKALI